MGELNWCVNSSVGIASPLSVSNHNSISGGFITGVRSLSGRAYLGEIRENKGEEFMDVMEILQLSFECFIGYRGSEFNGESDRVRLPLLFDSNFLIWFHHCSEMKIIDYAGF